jgi:hypothetical protein
VTTESVVWRARLFFFACAFDRIWKLETAAWNCNRSGTTGERFHVRVFFLFQLATIGSGPMLFLFLEDLIGNMRREEQSETNLIGNLTTKNNL